MTRNKQDFGTGAELEPRVQARLNAFLRERTLPRYLAARAAMIESRRFDPRSTVLPDVFRLLAKGHHQQVLAVTRAAIGNWVLNPGIHFVMSQALRDLGHTARAEKEYEFGRALLEGLLLTGDGSAERPYLVLRVADEYDVLASLSLRCRAHQVAFRGGRAYDALACEDGRDVWFDVTAAAVPDPVLLARPHARFDAVA